MYAMLKSCGMYKVEDSMGRAEFWFYAFCIRNIFWSYLKYKQTKNTYYRPTDPNNFSNSFRSNNHLCVWFVIIAFLLCQNYNQLSSFLCVVVLFGTIFNSGHTFRETITANSNNKLDFPFISYSVKEKKFILLN